MHDGMPYGQNQGQDQGHSREVDRQSPMGLILIFVGSLKTWRVLDYCATFNISISNSVICFLLSGNNQISCFIW